MRTILSHCIQNSTRKYLIRKASAINNNSQYISCLNMSQSPKITIRPTESISKHLGTIGVEMNLTINHNQSLDYYQAHQKGKKGKMRKSLVLFPIFSLENTKNNRRRFNRLKTIWSILCFYQAGRGSVKWIFLSLSFA